MAQKTVAGKSGKIMVPFTSVQKRDGRIVPFEQSRITNAAYRAMQAAGEGDLSRDPQRISERVVQTLARAYPSTHTPSIEEIQDAVEEALILMDFPKTAKAYILYRSKRAEVRERQKIVPDKVKELVAESKQYFKNPLGEFIYYRTYSRWMDGEGRRETWVETVSRYFDFMRENLGEKLKDEEYEELRQAVLHQEVMPSMRLMWSAGHAARKTNVSGYNCSFIAPSKLRDFAEIMYLLMCGTGVGFSVESQNVQKLPIIKRQNGNGSGNGNGKSHATKKKIPVHIIEDSKEGWGDALTLGLKTWYDGKDIQFDYSGLRPAGARLHTMGGRSSGPEPLRALLDFSRVKIFARQGKRLTNIDVHDIICKIGEVVVMGGVRRSALISLSDLDDADMRRAKTGQFYLSDPQRMMANNSAAYNEKPDAQTFLEEWLALAKSGTGERGIFNRGGLKTQLPARRWKMFAKDAATSGTNPCVTADTWIMTADGARQVRDLIGMSFDALVNGRAYNAPIGFFKTGVKDVFEIRTHRGFAFSATENHKVLIATYRSRKIQKTEWKEVKDLRIGDRIVLHNHKNISWNGNGSEAEGWLLGNLLGDGNIEKDGKANLDYWGITQSVMAEQAVALVHATVEARSDLTGHAAKTGYTRVQSMGLGELASVFGMSHGHKTVTEEIEYASSDFYRGFLRGWFDADGSVQGDQNKGVSVRLSSSSLPALQKAQRMLARLGVIGTIYTNRRNAALRWLPDGNGGKKMYFCKENHDLVISGENLTTFAERIRFSDSVKQKKLETTLGAYRRMLNQETFYSEVTEIAPREMEEVFDCSVEEAHAFDGNGAYLHNCGEIVLKSKQFCNLTEVVARANDTEESLLKKARLAAMLGTYQSTLTNFKYISKQWKENCEEERLLGVSITGQWDAPAVRNAGVLQKMRAKAVETNREYAKRFGINQSTCVTCVKPSGTVSQLVDAASGMHPRHGRFYIRRIRISASDPLFHMLKDQKFPYYPEVGQLESSATTYVLEFPVKAPGGAVFRNDLSAREQLEYWKMVKENFTEHNPSVTISVGEDEWIDTANWLYKNWEMLGGLSFLPRTEHVYKLSPYEEITEAQYSELVAKLPEIDFANIVTYEEDDETSGSHELACVSGVCEIDMGGDAEKGAPKEAAPVEA